MYIGALFGTYHDPLKRGFYEKQTDFTGTGLVVARIMREALPAGNGVIEANQVVHILGEVTLDFLNIPWGGVRKSPLPESALAKPDWIHKGGKIIKKKKNEF